jgi:hypothetical protein
LSRSNSDPDCYYVDTCYLRHYLNHPQGKDEPRIAKQAIEYLEYNHIALKVSEVSAGEFVRIVSLGESNETLLCNLYERVKSRQFAICWVQRSDIAKFLGLVDEVRNADYQLEPSDTLIIAQSLVDAKCRGLLTFDGPMMDSVGLKNVIKKHRPQFVVTDKPP